MLTSENMEELVRITSEEMRSAAGKLKERLDIIEAELRGVKARLARLYGAPETGKLGLDDLSPGIREPRARLAGLEKTRANVEAEIATGGIGPLDVDLIKKHAHDMRQLLVESSLTERKAFLRSLVRHIETDGKQVTIRYKLPLVQGAGGRGDVVVMPVDDPGGAGGIRTPYLLNAIQSLSQLSYSPTVSSYIVYNLS